jgi:tetratricopeptide (TPR) repeat protein
MKIISINNEEKKVKSILKKSSISSSILLLLLIFSPFLFGQFEEEDLLTEEVKCEPDSFNTVYDKFKLDSVSEQQVAIWYSLANEEYKYDNFSRALPYFWQVLMNDHTGKFKIVYSKIANCYFRLNQVDSTLLVSYMGLKKYPDYAQLHYWAGLVHDKLGHTKCAIPHYEKLVELDPKNKDYWSKLAALYYKIDDERAIDAQEKVVDLDPNNVEASRLLAEITTHFGGDPLEILKDTWQKDPKNIENAYRYGKEAFDVGKYREATEPFKEILAVNPRHTTAMEYLGRCYESIGQKNTALKYYNDILRIDPRNIKIICLIASVYNSQNNFVTARSQVNKAHRIDPNHGLPFMIMGEIYENAVTYCTNQRTKRTTEYDDKLVYRLAVEEYKKAARDPNYTADGNRRASQLENANLLPTKEDYFMHKNRLNPKDDCYSWIQ